MRQVKFKGWRGRAVATVQGKRVGTEQQVEKTVRTLATADCRYPRTSPLVLRTR